MTDLIAGSHVKRSNECLGVRSWSGFRLSGIIFGIELNRYRGNGQP